MKIPYDINIPTTVYNIHIRERGQQLSCALEKDFIGIFVF